MSKGWAGGSTTRWRKLRLHVLARDGWLCQIGATGCTREATHVDHIVPKGQGGMDDLTNLRAACAQCNQSKGNTPPRGHEDPEHSWNW